MSIMRAKMEVISVEVCEGVEQETLTFRPVGPSGGYPDGGADEDNTYSRYTPSGELTLTFQNPSLLGKFAVGDRYYLDFTEAK